MTTTTFTQRVYKLCRQIPRGKVATYGQLAMLAGSPRAARAVGMAMKQNPDAPHTPCHRVVAADGSLTGYSAGQGIPSKQQLLLKEGILFDGDKVAMQSSQWQPLSSAIL